MTFIVNFYIDYDIKEVHVRIFQCKKIFAAGLTYASNLLEYVNKISLNNQNVFLQISHFFSETLRKH